MSRSISMTAQSAVAAFSLAMAVGTLASAQMRNDASAPVYARAGTTITVGQGSYTFPAVPAQETPYALTGSSDEDRAPGFWNSRAGTTFSVGQGNYSVPALPDNGTR